MPRKLKQTKKTPTKEPKAWCGTSISIDLYQKLKSFLRAQSYQLDREYTMREWLEQKIIEDT